MVSINHIRADTYPGQPPTARLISCQDQDLAMMNSGLFHKHSPAASHDSNPHGQLHSLCELFLRFIEAAPRVPGPRIVARLVARVSRAQQIISPQGRPFPSSCRFNLKHQTRALLKEPLEIFIISFIVYRRAHGSTH